MSQRRLPMLMEGASPKTRKILLCIASEKPQIVARTVYGLATMRSRWVPSEVVIIAGSGPLDCPSSGAESKKHFDCVYRALAKSGRPQADVNVELLTSARQRPSTLYSPEIVRQRRDIGNFILKTVQRITDEDDTELWISLGPGRHLVACFFAGHALSLLGRPQDRLVQVLDGDTAECLSESNHEPAQICDVPFARIESLASVRELTRQVDYSTLCHGLDGNAHLQVSSAFGGLQFRFSNAFDIHCDSSHRPVGPRFEPRAAALYAYYAQCAQHASPYVRDEEILDNPDGFLAMYEACLVGGQRKSDPQVRRALTQEALRSARSRIGRTLKALVKGGARFADYRIYGRRSEASYGLSLHPEQIDFVDWAGLDAWRTSPLDEARC